MTRPEAAVVVHPDRQSLADGAAAHASSSRARSSG